MNDPIIALDFPNKDCVEKFLSNFSKEEKLYLKVGMELYYFEGRSILEYLKSLGHKIFLDLKLHDIPNTIENTMKIISSFDIDMVNVHAAGGKRMMEAALNGLEKGKINNNRPLLIAVTQLTSISEKEMKLDQMLDISLEESVINYSKLAKICGLDGVVCSALEANKVKEVISESFLCITPGIRLKNEDIDDQRRVVSVNNAKQLGSSYIVIGREITNSNEPFNIYKKVKACWIGE